MYYLNQNYGIFYVKFSYLVGWGKSKWCQEKMFPIPATRGQHWVWLVLVPHSLAALMEQFVQRPNLLFCVKNIKSITRLQWYPPTQPNTYQKRLNHVFRSYFQLTFFPFIFLILIKLGLIVSTGQQTILPIRYSASLWTDDELAVRLPPNKSQTQDSLQCGPQEEKWQGNYPSHEERADV